MSILDSVINDGNERNDVIINASTLNPKDGHISESLFDLGINLLDQAEYDLDNLNLGYSSTDIIATVDVEIKGYDLRLIEKIEGDFSSFNYGLIPYDSKIKNYKLFVYKNYSNRRYYQGRIDIDGFDLTVREFVESNDIESFFLNSNNTIIGTVKNDTRIYMGNGHDTYYGNGGSDWIDGQDGLDTLIVEGDSSNYSITKVITPSGYVFENYFSIQDLLDSSDWNTKYQIKNVEYLKFTDQTLSTSDYYDSKKHYQKIARINSQFVADTKGFASTSGLAPVYIISPFEIGKETTLDSVKDFDGNLHAGDNFDDTPSSYKYQGMLDVNGDGIFEAIFTNKSSKRWVTAEIDSKNGYVDYSDHGQGGTTRVVGIYIDPLVTSGEVEQFGPHDSQRRFQNDLKIDNLIAKHSGDYDSDGIHEVYWKTNDGTAYLRALMHSDGNIRYANYQSKEQISDYLTSNGYESFISDII